MDPTPSLSRSPASPPNSYCASETSSLEYPSPDLVSQQYKISALYGAESFCSIAPHQDTGISLFSLDAMAQPNWDHTAATIHAPSTSAALATHLSMEYGPFGGFSSAAPAVYSPGLYTGVPQPQKPTLSSVAPPPIAVQPRAPARPSSRPPASISVPSAVVLGSSSWDDASAPSYPHVAGASRIPAARTIRLPYQIGPTGTYGTEAISGGVTGCMSSDRAASWEAPAAAPAGHVFQGGHDRWQQAAGPAPEHQPRGARPRRQPRRLTSKEEANFQCEVKGCGKLFGRSYNYKAHMETHDEKREYPFPCQIPSCTKRFVRKTDLQRHHHSVHMKERNYKCDFCGRLFARKDTLRRHMDDGCSKRFDIGTLDLRTGDISNQASGQQDHLWRVR